MDPTPFGNQNGMSELLGSRKRDIWSASHWPEDPKHPLRTPHVPPKRHLVPPVPCQLGVYEGQLAIENPYEHLLTWFT